MFNLKSACLGLFSASLISNLTYADEIGHVPIFFNNFTLTQSHTTQGLKPIPDSYKLAKLQFLPDMKDSENGWGGHNLNNKFSGTCSYQLTLPICNVPNCITCVTGTPTKCSVCKSGCLLGMFGSCECPSLEDASNNCVSQMCNGIEYCCPFGASCATMANGGPMCYPKDKVLAP